MNKAKTYNIFLFLSTFTRSLVEVFSLVLLYQKGYTINDLFFFLTIMYLMGIIVSKLGLSLSYKLVLIISSIIYGLSYIYLFYINKSIISLSILAILLGLGTYSYHIIRHALALILLDDKKRRPHKIILITYLGTIFSSLIGMLLIDKLPRHITSIIIFIMSFIAILPIFSLSQERLSGKNNTYLVRIPRSKLIFSILEQAKVIFLELQPLFLYIYINKSIYYVGIFNIITNIASLIVVYLLSTKLKKANFKYYTIILGIILILKLNIKSGLVLLLIALLEGIFIKIYETFSLDNLYSHDNTPIIPYLYTEEIIFFTTKTIIMFIFYFLNINFYIIMYFNIIVLILSGIFITKEK